jgi:lysophospholipase L1-like esterase
VLHSYVAVGDSFTEGLDDVRPDGSYRGWADLVAAELAQHNPGLRYANLAVRGRRMAHIRDQQVPFVERVRPSLVSIAAGGNDVLGLRCDVPGLVAGMRGMLHRLADAADTVVVFAGFDPRGRLPLGQVLALRTGPYNAALLESAAEVGAVVVDLWHLPGLSQPRMWAPDRLHLSADGHALVAVEVLRALGPITGVVDLRDHVDLDREADTLREHDARLRWLAARRADAEWARTYFAPWVGRRLRGRSSGDLLGPKVPDLVQLDPMPPAREQSAR